MSITALLIANRGVIDPVESRVWIMRGLRSVPPAPGRSGKKRPFVDTW